MTFRPRVVSASDASADPALKEDNYIQKVVRYIPGEIVAVYTTASGLVLSAQGVPTVTVLWIVAGVLLVLTPFWLYYATALPGKPAPWFQVASGTLAYLVWVFALAGGTLFPWYHPLYGSLLLLFYTLAVPLAEKAFTRAR
jgi:hypothetical protein